MDKSQHSPLEERFFNYLKVHAEGKMKITGDQIIVTMGKNIFGYELDIFLSAKDELTEIFTDGAWVSQTVVSVYIRYNIQL